MCSKIIALLVTLGLIITSCIPIKDCGNNLDCFKDLAKTCSKVRMNQIQDGNNIRITLRGFEGDYCVVSFKIEGISKDIMDKYPFESKVALDKTLNCHIDKKYQDPTKLDYLEEISKISENINDSCSGPIKDFMKGPGKDVLSEQLNIIITT